MILSGSGLIKIFLIVEAAASLGDTSLDGAVVMVDPTERLKDVATGAPSGVGFVLFSLDWDGVLLANADAESEG